jgi:dTDP-4-amino-4,6-dideoxygalactose transaminase
VSDSTQRPRVWLSPPHLGEDEARLVQEAIASNWVAPVGPHLDALERTVAERVGKHAVALSSGTAAIHLSLRLLGIQPGDEVLCSTFTFAATAFPVLYEDARPVFIDAERSSWNMDPALLRAELEELSAAGRPPRAVIVVDLFGQVADMDPILAACADHGVPLIEDAAESLGATYKGRQAGSFGDFGVFSFNGNKIITTSGGGMLLTGDEDRAQKARFMATQARDPAPHYQHSELGFNYRLSNILAALGLGQLGVLEERVEARRHNFTFYENALAGLPGVEFMPEPDYSRSNRWLTCLTIDPEAFGATREDIRLALAEENIEARPVWKPLHLQPLFAGCRTQGGSVGEELFRDGLCLPSGSSMTEEDLARTVTVVRNCARISGAPASR